MAQGYVFPPDRAAGSTRPPPPLRPPTSYFWGSAASPHLPRLPGMFWSEQNIEASKTIALEVPWTAATNWWCGLSSVS